MEEIRALAPDLALLPVKGRDTERVGNGVPGNDRLEEAIALMAATGISFALGRHYSLFAFNTEEPARIDAAAAGQPGFERARLGMAYRLRAA